MVRVNILNPGDLADQHLIAEYAEIMMLMTYIKSYQKVEYMPEHYCLGKGHQVFFKDKLKYLKRRHEALKEEMRKRGFKPKHSVSLKGYNKELLNDWKPGMEDKKIIKKRLIKRIREKPNFYRYHGKKKPVKFFIDMIRKA